MKRANVDLQVFGRNHGGWLVRGVCGALAMVLGGSSVALGGAEYDVSLNYYKDGSFQSVEASGSDESSVHYQSFSGGVGSGWTLGSGESIAFASGRADAGSLSLGVSAQVISTPANTHFSDTRVRTDVWNRVTVSAGSSGLAVGDPTVLRLEIRVDGNLHAKGFSWPGSSWAHADIDASLTIRDYALRVEDEEGGAYVPRAASFGMSGELEAYDVYKPFWNYAYYSMWTEMWQTESNIRPRTYHDNMGEKEELSESMHFDVGHYLDTGTLSIEFEAIVGHTLDIDANMFTYVNANNDAEALADFYNTFAFDVTPAVGGVSLAWQVVPEPGSVSLLALGGLMALRRRRRK